MTEDMTENVDSEHAQSEASSREGAMHLTVKCSPTNVGREMSQTSLYYENECRIHIASEHLERINTKCILFPNFKG